LQAGTADQALAAGEQAIKMDAGRWEGYALAGGALMNLKRYEEAADRLSSAIEHAPQDKQSGLRELRRQCFAAESGSLPKPQAPPAPSNTEATTTQAEIVLWKSIENSNDRVDFETYLAQYPAGAFAQLAKAHLDAIGKPDLPTIDMPTGAARLQRAWSKADAWPMSDLGNGKIVIITGAERLDSRFWPNEWPAVRVRPGDPLALFLQIRDQTSLGWSVISLQGGDVIRVVGQYSYPSLCGWHGGGCIVFDTNGDSCDPSAPLSFCLGRHDRYADLSNTGDVTLTHWLKDPLSSGIGAGGNVSAIAGQAGLMQELGGQLWNLDQNKPLCFLSNVVKRPKLPVLPLPPQPLESYVLSLSGRVLGVSTGEGSVKLYSTADCKPVGSLDGHAGTPKFVSGTDDDHVVLTLDGDGNVRLWDLDHQKGGDIVTRLASGKQGDAALSADGKLFAVLDNKVVTLWDVESRKPIQKVYDFHSPDPASQPKHLVFSKDGTLLVWGDHLLTAFRSQQAATPKTGTFSNPN
jgi:tetratricopeptide repeat protein